MEDRQKDVLGSLRVKIRGRRFMVTPFNRRFWEKAAAGTWEPYTFAILSRLLEPDMVYCDMGAWIGPTVLYAAMKVRQVVCFEPDPVAYQHLCTNIRLNRLANVTTHRTALSTRNGTACLASFKKRLGDSMSSLLAPGTPGNRTRVTTTAWAQVVRGQEMGRFHFIKMDVEGSEFDLLPTMQQYLSDQRPLLYVSFHPHLLPSGQKKQKMAEMAEILAGYGHCLDRALKPVDIGALLADTVLEKGGAFLFADKAI